MPTSDTTNNQGGGLTKEALNKRDSLLLLDEEARLFIK